MAAGLNAIYQATTAQEAKHRFDKFAGQWDERYPLMAKSWCSNWVRLVPVFGCPLEIRREIRRAVYTIQSLKMSLRKVITTSANFPWDEAAFKLLYLALQNIQRKWTMPISNQGRALNALDSLFEERLPTNF